MSQCCKGKIERFGLDSSICTHEFLNWAGIKVVYEIFDHTMATQDGRSIDTSMGMTPLEGLVMGTRSGDSDPAIVPYTMEKDPNQ